MWRWYFISFLLFAMRGACVSGEPVRVAAPEPLGELAQAWGNAAGVLVQVRAFESNECIRRAGRGEFDLALVSEPLSEGQKRSLGAQPGAVPQVSVVGWEAATLIVHPDNPLAYLEEDQARRVFSGEDCQVPRIHQWSEFAQLGSWTRNPIGKILPPSLEPEGRALREMLLGKKCGMDEEAYQVSGDAVRERIVAASPEALGAVHCLRHIGIARPLPVLVKGEDGPTLPSSQTLSSGEYPFGRKIWMAAPKLYYLPHPAAKLTAYALSPEGQFEVARLGFFPAR